MSKTPEFSLEFRSMFDRSPIPLTLATATSGDTPLIHVNGAFEKLSGYGADELVGRNCRLMQGPQTSRASRSTMREAIDTFSEASVMVTNYRRDGAVFESFVFLFPITSGDTKSPKYFLGSQYDVTGPLQQMSFAEHTSHLRSHVETGALQLLHGSRLVLESKKLMSRSLYAMLVSSLHR